MFFNEHYEIQRSLGINYIRNKTKDYWNSYKNFSKIVEKFSEETDMFSETEIKIIVYNTLKGRNNKKFLKEQLRMTGLIKRAGIDYIEHIQKLEENGTMKEIYKKFM